MERPRLPETAAGVLAAGVVLVVLRGRGVDLSPDSISYLAAADNVMQGKGLLDFQGDPLILWPPFYPLVLAGVARAVGGVLTAGVAVNALAQGLATALVVRWWRRLGVATPLLAAGALILALNRVTLHTVGFLWSEPLYGLCCLAAAAVVGSTTGPVSLRRALATGALAGAAWATKYMGAGAVAAVVAVILVAGRRRAWTMAALAAAVAAAPAAVWFGHNLQATGSLTGPRLPGPGFSFAMVLEAWRVLSRVFLSGVLGPPVVAALVLAGLYRLPAGDDALAPARRRAALAAGALLLAHAATLIASVSLVAMDGIGRRFMQPAVAPAVFLAILLLDRQRRRPRLARWVPALAALLAIYPTVFGLNLLREGRPLSDGDRPAPALALPPQPWYSNDPLQVYRWYRQPVAHTPAWQRNPTVAIHPTPDRWPDLLRARGGDGAFLWVGRRDDPRLAAAQAIAGIGWQEAGADSQLVVYRLHAR